LDCFAALAIDVSNPLQRQFRLAAGVAARAMVEGRSRGAHKLQPDEVAMPRILPDHDLAGAAGAVIAARNTLVFQLDLVVERLEGPDVPVSAAPASPRARRKDGSP